MVNNGKLILGLLVCNMAVTSVLVYNAVTTGAISHTVPASLTLGVANKDTPSKPGPTLEPTPSSAERGDKNKDEATPIPTAATGTTGDLSDTQLEQKITDYLTKNPEKIVEALQKFNQNQQRAQQEKIEASLTKYKTDISKDSSAVVLGNKDAETKLVVFLDPNCPHCRPFSQALSKIGPNYPNVAILVRHWPILGPDSEDVARGLWAIKEQGPDKYAAIMKAIAISEERFTLPKLLAWVEEHKMDIPKFKNDFEAQTTKNVVDETKKLATNIGFEGTPTSVLIDKKGIRLVMPTDEKSLEAILKETSKEEIAKT